MSAVAAPAPAKSPAKKRSAKPKKASSHPTYFDMIKKAIAVLKERNGSSRQAILKYITANFKVGDKTQANSHLKMALKNGVKKGTLKQSKGAGASGSFKLGEKKVAAKKPAAKKPKTAAKKVKKPKAAGAKKPKTKKPKTTATKKPKTKKPKTKTAKKSPAKKGTKKTKKPAKK